MTTRSFSRLSRAARAGRLRVVMSVVVLLVLAGSPNVTAAADAKLPLGGGAGVVAEGSYRTLTAIAGFVIAGIGPDPAYRQPACELGAATGESCRGIGSLAGPGPHMSMPGLFQPGDDGGPVTSDNLLIAMIRGGMFAPGDLLGMPSYNFLTLTAFSAILDDVNTTGGPGAGFTLAPAPRRAS